MNNENNYAHKYTNYTIKSSNIHLNPAPIEMDTSEGTV
jgi:hypothetical protein